MKGMYLLTYICSASVQKGVPMGTLCGGPVNPWDRDPEVRPIGYTTPVPGLNSEFADIQAISPGSLQMVGTVSSRYAP